MDTDELIQQIENVEIQGATAIARAGVEHLQMLAADGADQETLEKATDRLKQARPTEPFLRNALNTALDTGNYADVLDHIDGSQTQIREHVTGTLTDTGEPLEVYTHCHSSTVTGAVVHLQDNGRDVAVHNTETRPLYQGRETAAELADHNIPVQHYVDSGGRLALERADVMLIGADAVTPDGTVLNKIGSNLFAATAQQLDVPVYVLTDAWKFDATMHDVTATDLEERNGSEVWDNAPDGVQVNNYAFEPVNPENITGIISELGVYNPEAFVEQVQETYPAISE